MKSFPYLIQLGHSCDAARMREVALAIKLLFYPRVLSQIIARVSASANQHGCFAPPDQNYLLRMRGKLHPFEYVIPQPGQGRPYLTLSAAYWEMAGRYVEARVMLARMFCYEELAKMYPGQRLQVAELDRLLRAMSNVSEGTPDAMTRHYAACTALKVYADPSKVTLFSARRSPTGRSLTEASAAGKTPQI